MSINTVSANSVNNKTTLMEHEGGSILERIGLPVAEGKLAKSKEEALHIANDLHYPIVLKGMSPEITHKSDAGIVKLPIQSPAELEEAYDEISENVKRYDASATLKGVLVQKMASKGQELIIGLNKDPVFGHQLVIGTGGVFVEILKDFAVRMMPVSPEEIKAMVKELKSYPLLEGYRGEKGIAMNALIDICLGLNQLVTEKPELEELDLNPVIFSGDKATICDVRMMLGSQEKESRTPKSLDALEQMLNPKSIAVIGASQDENKNGGRLFRYIVENNYAGELYPVNPKATSIKGYTAYPSLTDIPNDVELACIIVAAKFVPDVMRDCVKKGVHAAIIYTSGFAEIGEEGQALQQEVLDIAKEGNIRVLGPNSIGIASPSQKVFTAFGSALESKTKLPGHIGFISQSGAMGSALLSRAWEEGAGFSRWISVANEADLTTSDFINVLADDELTKVITVFMEGVKDAYSFQLAAEKALEQKKPLLVYKTGKSSAGKRAVQSHTGSIAGDDAAYSAAFQKYGALRIDHLGEMIDVAKAFEVQPLPNGKKIGVLTASGGACSIIADLCTENNLLVPELTNTAEKISPHIPSFGSATNPIDVTAEIIAKPEMFKSVLETLVDDTEVDGVIVMLSTNADPGATVIAKAIMEVFQKQQNKPIVVGRMGADAIAPKAMEFYREHHFPVYSTPEQVVNVMSYLVSYQNILNEKNRTSNGASTGGRM